MPETITILAGGVEIPAEPGISVLAAFQRGGAKIQTVCKGRGICGACRVRVDDAFIGRLPPPSFNETRLLGYLKSAANNRLACQIILDATLDGLSVTPDPLPIRTLSQESTT